MITAVEHGFAQWQLQRAAASAHAVQFATVSSEDELRITKFAGAAFYELGSTSQGVRAAKAGRLLLNGDAAEQSRRVRLGDTVALLPTAEEPIREAEASHHIRFAEGLVKSGQLSVQFEDEAFAIVNKPAGVHSKPYGGALSLEHALPGLISPPLGASDALARPTCVHRLDARVSGLIVVAKTRSSAAFLAQAFRERRVRKTYRALVLGRVDEAALRSNAAVQRAEEVEEAGEDGEEQGGGSCWRIASMMRDGGEDGGGVRKAATTLARPLELTPHVQAGWLTTLDLHPRTGRRHQLRRHCAEQLRAPICGDDLYAAPGGGFAGKRSAGLFLQSIAVAVPHPAANGTVVEARIPEVSASQSPLTRCSNSQEYIHCSEDH